MTVPTGKEWPGSGLRAAAVLISLVMPGVGHFVLGAFGRGAIWAVGIPVLGYIALFFSRDNASDSRYWGLVTRDKIKGRADWIHWSWDSERHWLRSERLWRSL